MDWFHLASNALWILACAIALATVSHASWQASQNKTGLIPQLQQRAYRLPLTAAGIAFSLGLAGICANLLQALFWIVMALVFLGLMTTTTFEKRRG